MEQQELHAHRERKRKAGEKRKWDMFDEDMEYGEGFSRYIMSCRKYCTKET